MKQTKLYKEYSDTLRKYADVEHSIAVLSWDKEVNMPPDGNAFRTQQIATLSGIAHEIATSERFGDVLEELHGNDKELDKEALKNVQLSHNDYQRGKKLSHEFVVRRSTVCSNAYHQWLKAREANDFNLFKDTLEEVVKIKREEAELVGYEGHPYDALLDEYEANYTAAMLDTLFTDVKAKLVDFVREIRGQEQVNDAFLLKHFPKQAQWDYSVDILKKIGYNFKAGRQDWSPHPFTTTFSPQDVRVTTRVSENDFNSLLWSSIHEGGHALYEQGLPAEKYGLPSSRYTSLGIHESQSRLWENNVGRSLPFWKAQYSNLQQHFPTQFGNVPVEQFYKGINKVQSSFIRTESDELHYHFHILIRYELEKALLEDNLQVADLEDAWNEKYKAYLDIDVPSANQGILQDVHWAYGSIGYFPTYSLGSFYAAQFYHQATKDIDGLEAQIQAGDSSKLLTWLQQNIHQYGRTYSALELCERTTAEALNFDYFYKYAVEKYSGIYGL